MRSATAKTHFSIKVVLIMERVAGIEPASSAWKAEVLPLNHTRVPNFTAHYLFSSINVAVKHGGGRRIRTFEGIAVRFTV